MSIFEKLFRASNPEAQPKDEVAERITAYAKRKRTFTVPELQTQLSLGYYDVQRRMEKLLKDKAVEYAGGLIYNCLLPPDEPAEQPAPQPEPAQTEGEEGDASLEQFMARRQELIQRIHNDFRDLDDDDGNDDDGNDDDGADDIDVMDDEDDGFGEDHPEIRQFVRALQTEQRVFPVDDEYFILPDFFSFEGRDARFKLIVGKDGKICISDDGAAFSVLRRLSAEVPDEAIDDLLRRYHVRKELDELRLDVPMPQESFACLMRLFATMDAVARLARTPAQEAAAPMPPDPDFLAALKLVVERGKASISFLNREGGLGYARAGSALDWMEAQGYVTPFDGAHGRKVLLTPDRFRALYGSPD